MPGGESWVLPMDPSKRFLTIVLAAGVVILLVAIFVGERMGGRVFVQAQRSGDVETQPVVTPLPQATPADGYGPDWKRTQTLAAAVDPGFPDPRVPPVAPPTPLPAPRETPTPRPAWTPNPKIPIWDQTPPPRATASPASEASGQPTGEPSVSPSPIPGTKSTSTPQP